MSTYKSKARSVVIFFIAFLGFYLVQNTIFSEENNISTQQIVTESSVDSSEPDASSENFNDVMLTEKALKKLTYYINNLIEQKFLNINVFISTSITFLLLLFVASFISLCFHYIIFPRFFRIIEKKARYKKDIQHLKTIPKYFRYGITLFSMRLFFTILGSYNTINFQWIQSILEATFILIITIIIQKIATTFLSIWLRHIAKKSQSNADDQLLPIFVSSSKITILIFGLFFCLSALQINITPFLASLGAFTFALGLAIKDSLGNFIAGIFLILDESFRVGDKIDIPDIGVGYINEIGFRTTRILTFDNEIIVIPNNTMVNSQFKSYALPNSMVRVSVSFGVNYGSDIQQVKDVVLPLLLSDHEILKEPKPYVEFHSMQDFYLSFLARAYVSDYKSQYDKMIELTEKIYNALNKADIGIPFPTYTVNLQNNIQQKT